MTNHDQHLPGQDTTTVTNTTNTKTPFTMKSAPFILKSNPTSDNASSSAETQKDHSGESSFGIQLLLFTVTLTANMLAINTIPSPCQCHHLVSSCIGRRRSINFPLFFLMTIIMSEYADLQRMPEREIRLGVWSYHVHTLCHTLLHHNQHHRLHSLSNLMLIHNLRVVRSGHLPNLPRPNYQLQLYKVQGWLIFGENWHD